MRPSLASCSCSRTSSGEFRRLYRWKPGGDAGARHPRDGDGRRRSSILDDAKARLYLSLNDRGYQRLRVHDARTLAELKVPVPADAAAVTVGSVSRRRPFRRRRRSTPARRRAPASSSTGRRAASRSGRWPPRPRSTWRSSSPARLESYTARDGTKIPMFVRYPAQCAPEAAATRRSVPDRGRVPRRARKGRRRRASAASRRSSSMPGSSSSSPTSAAATATARPGSTPTTARSAST